MPAALGGVFDHCRLVVAANRAEGVEGRHVEEHGAIDVVGVALVVERLHHLDHLGNPLGGVRLVEDGSGVEGNHVAVEASGLGCSKLKKVDTKFASFGQDRIVDVGDVANKLHRVAEVFKPPDQQVVGEVGVGVSEVGRVVGRDATDVHLDLGSRLKRDDGLARGIEELHGRQR